MKWFAIIFVFTCCCDSAPLRNFSLAGTYTDRAVLIKIGDGEGSGFFLLTSNAVFLATARHVLFDQQNNWHLFAPKATLSAFDSNGFPTSIGLDESPQIDKNLPLLRKGILAGVNKNTKKLILDFSVCPGDSGGLVMLRQSDGLNYRFYCIGIQTEWVPFRDVVQSTRFKYLNQNLSNSGYSICEPADTILEMLW